MTTIGNLTFLSTIKLHKNQDRQPQQKNNLAEFSYGLVTLLSSHFLCRYTEKNKKQKQNTSFALNIIALNF